MVFSLPGTPRARFGLLPRPARKAPEPPLRLNDDPPFYSEPPVKKFGGSEFGIRAEVHAYEKKNAEDKRMTVRAWGMTTATVDRAVEVCELRRDNSWTCGEPEMYIIKFVPKCLTNHMEVQKFPPKSST